MYHLDVTTRIRSSSKANAYLKVLVDKRVFARMVDGYLFAAAYAMKQNLERVSLVGGGRHEIIVFGSIDRDVRLALEAGVYALCKQNGQSEPRDSQELAERVMEYAEAGLRVLQKRWEGKIGSQIQNDIVKLLQVVTIT
ncbi:hypothetical protein K4A83_02530 [Spirulina subsalsa FACHB-351]|uniref:Uncharacterized protein n=1 Tax=Spirulina subsalsa FACHB-351 TaxID=234711 RepID=A0ABT3L0W5_9CYAN|nr:hypothetical protein [Spirulina subsalsa]MCW6035150.1 hypothetical protein [Spirulina subsalsa FACHB-351]